MVNRSHLFAAFGIAALAASTLVLASACGKSANGSTATASNTTAGTSAAAQATDSSTAPAGDGSADAAEPDNDQSDMGPSVSASELPKGVEVEHNVAYGSDPSQVMDVYHTAAAKGAPVIMMVHGGGWRRGDKAAKGVVLNKVKHYVPEGYIFISVNYRLVPKVTPVDEANDVAAALAFAQAHAQSWGGDSSKFVLMGHSAGANLVAQIASNPTLASSHSVRPWLGTIVLDSAAYNVVTIMEASHLKLYDVAFGKDQALWAAASPTLQLKAAPATPMLLVCSSDRSDSCPAAQEYATKATGFGGKATVLPEALKHGEINANLGLAGPYTDAVDAFLHSIGLP